MIKVVNRFLLFFFALIISFPVQADIYNKASLLGTIEGNSKIKYDYKNESITLYADPSYFRIIIKGLFAYGFTSASVLCLGSAAADLWKGQGQSAELLCLGLMLAIPSALFIKLLADDIANKTDDIPYVIIDDQGISCTAWDSFRKISWHDLKSLCMRTQTRDGWVVSRDLSFKLYNGDKYIIGEALLPLSIKEFQSIIEYYWN